MKSIRIPEPVTEIRPYAFCGLESIETVEICGIDTIVGYYAFQGCRNLKTIICNAEKIELGAIANCKSLSHVQINNTKYIGPYAFHSDENVDEINIPDSVKEIGQEAFYLCSLSELKLPRGVKQVGCKVVSTGRHAVLSPGKFSPTNDRCCKNIVLYDTIENPITDIGYNTSQLDYVITVKSHETDEVILKIHMGADEKQSEYYDLLAKSWDGFCRFDFKKLSDFFNEIKGKKYKINAELALLIFYKAITPEEYDICVKYLCRYYKDAIAQTSEENEEEMQDFLSSINKKG